jgi:response regulator RpfG family c-di-GMP phosphodiesterase
MTKQNQTQINKLEKILIVNDDSADILAMQARLPENIVVHGASQWQAQEMTDTSGYNLIVVDNDANDLKESKGKETVQEIRTKNPDTPIIYTSFQPGWVAGEVYQTRGVQLVQTDKALDNISERFGIKLRKPQANGGIIIPNLHILLTDNTVSGHKPGIHTASN